MKKNWLVIISAVLLLLSGCESVTPKVDDPQSASTEATAIDTKFTLPCTLVVEKFDLEIVSVKLFESITLNAGVDFPVNAEDGKQLLVLCIDAKNTGDEICNLGSFIAYADSVSVLPSNYLGKYEDRVIFVGAVQPGKTMCTYIIYQVPSAWQNFEFSYVDPMDGKISKSITINRSDIS